MPTLTSEGVDDSKEFSAQENITRVGVSFLADQSRKSQYKASAMKQNTTLSTRLYNELTGEESPSPDSPEGEGSLTPDPSPQSEGSETPGTNTGGETPDPENPGGEGGEGGGNPGSDMD